MIPLAFVWLSSPFALVTLCYRTPQLTSSSRPGLGGETPTSVQENTQIWSVLISDQNIRTLPATPGRSRDGLSQRAAVARMGRAECPPGAACTGRWRATCLCCRPGQRRSVARPGCCQQPGAGGSATQPRPVATQPATQNKRSLGLGRPPTGPRKLASSPGQMTARPPCIGHQLTSAHGRTCAAKHFAKAADTVMCGPCDDSSRQLIKAWFVQVSARITHRFGPDPCGHRLCTRIT